MSPDDARRAARLEFGGVEQVKDWNRAFIVQSPGSEVGTRILVLVLVALSIVGVGILACLVPARRAARLDPLAAIRHE